MGMLLRGRKRPVEQTDTSHGVLKKKVLSRQGQIVFLPSEVLYIICDYLDVNSLVSLCRVSWRFQKLVQPLIFTEFHSGLYDQPGLWKRLELLEEAFTRNPTFAQKMLYISVKLHELKHVEKLTKLLRPVLHKTTRLCFLSLPIHTATANLLNSHAFGYLGKDLKIKAAYNRIISLSEITIVRSPIQCGQMYTYHRPDEFQLQRMVVGSCGLDYRSTIRILQGLRKLEVLEFYQVELWDSASFDCESKVAGIIKALDSSKSHLKELALHISGFRDYWSGFSRIPSFDSFSHLRKLEINEQDLAADVVFPASLTELMFVDWEQQPNFPFTKDLAQKSLPIHLEYITSYSRAPDILRQALKQTWGSHEIKIDYCKLDDSLPRGPFRVPESPS